MDNYGYYYATTKVKNYDLWIKMYIFQSKKHSF